MSLLDRIRSHYARTPADYDDWHATYPNLTRLGIEPHTTLDLRGLDQQIGTAIEEAFEDGRSFGHGELGFAPPTPDQADA